MLRQISIVFLLLLALLSIVVGVSLFSQNQAFAQGSGYSSYENPDNGFAIDYPSDWQVDNGNPATFQPALGTLGDSQQVQVIVTAVNNPVSSTLQGYTNYEVNYLRSQADGFTLYQSYRSALAGLPAFVLVYGDNGYLSDGLERNVEIYALDQQGTLYKVEYSASPELFSSYFQIAKNMISSFNLSGVSPSSPSSQPSGGSGSGNEGSTSSSGCPTPGPGGCNGAFSNGPGPYSPLNPNFGQAPLQPNIPEFDPNNP